MSPFSRLLFVLTLGFAGATSLPAIEAQAQSPACQQIRAEMASLPRSRPSGNTSGLRRELGRVQLALQSNDCFRSSGFLGLGGPPPVCGPLKAQAGQLQAQIRAAEGGGMDERRAQLIAAWQRYGCDGNQRPEPRQARGGVLYASPDDRPGILDRLFGNRTEVPVESYPRPGVAPPGIQPFDDSLRGEDGEENEPRRRRGGSVAVCVRTCDGFFFPVNFEGLRARDEYEDVCKTLCPAAQTKVYFMSYGGQIEDAAARDGEPYTALPAAKKYQENRDLACICKHPTQTWASAMKDKPDLVEMRKGDIVVSKEQAEIMSRPKELKVPGTNPRQKDALGKLAGETTPPVQQKKNYVSAEDGVTRETTREDGSRAIIRNVAPTLNEQGLRRGSGEARQP
ncbi:MAG: DUF2865 domain-containing protein [Proteobacteria bacterium]|nr:DUF2865 domain-containing protein [Pseudomonadota bacterium]